MGRYGNSNYGLIIKPKHIVCASYRDTYTLNTRDDEEKLFNIRPPLMLPQEIEDICIQQTIEENGEMLNYETTHVYPEIVVDEYEIEGVYYISYGEKEFAKDYERAKRVAEERGLSLIERDISKYREEHGLKPMTENAKRNLCRNILWKCCDGDKELEQSYRSFSKSFIKYHFQEFKETYLQLRIMGLEEQLYVGMDFENISYDKLLERAESILEENKKAEEQEKGVEQPTEETTPKTDEILENDMRINECGEIIRENVTRENVIPDFVVTEELTQGKASKQLEQLQQENLTINLWNKRFQNWYSAIDRVSQSVKDKFVKMKSDIIKTIGKKLKERTNNKQVSKQEQNTNER